MSKKYIVLYADEDGGVSIKFMTKEQIKENFLNDIDPPYNFFDKLPNLGYDSGILIIEGEIVVPKAKEKITEWDL